MISGTKILKHLDNVIEKRPITAQIKLDNYCNNLCSYCRYVGVPVKERLSVSLNDFEKWVEILQGLGVKGFILTGGEPTICEEFDEITKWLEFKQIPYGINTNFNVLKYIKPVYLKVSLDGYDSESYKYFRNVDMYSKTIENIKQYIEWKKENNVKTNIGLQKIGVDVEGCKRFYEAHKGLEVDYIVFRPMETVNNFFYDGKDEKPVIEFLEKLKEKDKRVQINFKYYQLRECFEKCYGSFLQIAVNPNGDVCYCCHKSDEIVGHITDSDILEKLRRYETNMKTCPVPCRMTGANSLLRNMAKVGADDVFI